VFFSTDWPNPVLGDANATLMSCYAGLVMDAGAVADKLRGLTVDRDTYNSLRDSAPTSCVDEAVRLLYLNRIGFSGLYRENARGHFNVPYGGDRTLAPLLRPQRLDSAAEALRTAILRTQSFEETISQSPADALIYCDPPFVTEGSSGDFARYHSSAFSFAGQISLSDSLRARVDAGALAVVSNTVDPGVARLYPDSELVKVERKRRFGRQARLVTEGIYVLHSDPPFRAKIAHILEKSLLGGSL